MKSFTTPIEEIPLSSISLNDIRYKISRPVPSEALKQSVLINGILDPLLLIYDDGYYIMMAGHNRATLLKDANFISVKARVFDSFRADMFLEYGLMKNYHNELGPIGKLKLFDLIERSADVNAGIKNLCKNNLNLPPEFTKNTDLRKNILEFPVSLLHYIDEKDINYRIIIELARWEPEPLQIISGWVGLVPMRVNIFKSIVDMTADIIKRDHHSNHLNAIDIENIQDRRSQEQYLAESLRKIRYPEYTELKTRASALIHEIGKSGISVSLPEYFEGDTISLTVTASRKGGIETLQEQIRGINFNKVKELLDLL